MHIDNRELCLRAAARARAQGAGRGARGGGRRLTRKLPSSIWSRGWRSRPRASAGRWRRPARSACGARRCRPLRHTALITFTYTGICCCYGFTYRFVSFLYYKERKMARQLCAFCLITSIILTGLHTNIFQRTSRSPTPRTRIYIFKILHLPICMRNLNPACVHPYRCMYK